MWLHLARRDRAGAAAQLIGRLAQGRPGLCFLMTGPGESPPDGPPLPANTIWAPLEQPDPATARDFVAHWRPDLALWLGWSGEVTLLTATQARPMPRLLIEADAGEPRGWLRDRTRQRIPWEAFTRIHARSATAAKALARQGAPRDITEVSGLLQDAPMLPGCNEPDREALMEMLAGRPVWLADGVTRDEEDAILETHMQARRASQRLLLVLRPADPERAPALVARLRDSTRLVTGDWTEGDWPDKQTDVLVVDGLGEDGLWVRVAALTFAGGTLARGETRDITASGEARDTDARGEARDGPDPRIALAFGSVVLHGPETGSQAGIYAQLADAGAVRPVKDAPGLARALQQLLAPDRAAAMALAAWEVLSEGAELTDRLVDTILDTLDRAPGGGT